MSRIFTAAHSARHVKGLLQRQLRNPAVDRICLRYSSSIVTAEEVESILSKPTWSVKALLPSDAQSADAPIITHAQLRHLLKLSALPEPKDEEEQSKILKTLRSQLHFVRAIQAVDTKGVSPLRAIRDETQAAEEEARISLDSVKEALAQEVVRGKHYKRIQRKEGPVDTKGAEDWDVMGHAERKAGRYFLVDSGKA